MTAGEQDFGRHGVMLSEQFNGFVSVAIQNGILQLTVLFEFMSIAVLNDFGEIAITERALMQFKTKTDQYVGLASGN